MATKQPTITDIVEQEVACLLDRGFPLFLNLKEIHDHFGFNENDIRRIMATKTPILSGRYTLRDVLYAIHGV